MTIASYAAYATELNNPFFTFIDTKVSATVIAGRLSSLWAVAPDAGAAPTTAAVPTRATAGALGQPDGASGTRILRSVASLSVQGTIFVFDRLSHQGGLSGITAGAQTTNLPTAALTRYTSGVGVMAFLEIYSAVGATGTTVTVSYTNQAGTAGQTSQAAAFGATGFLAVGQLIRISPSNSDTGIRSVENVNLVATTGTTGNFGVTLAKPILAIPFPTPSQIMSMDSLFTVGALPDLANGACIFYGVHATSTASGVLLKSYNMSED